MKLDLDMNRDELTAKLEVYLGSLLQSIIKRKIKRAEIIFVY